jgi:hypothetical protein
MGNAWSFLEQAKIETQCNAKSGLTEIFATLFARLAKRQKVRKAFILIDAQTRQSTKELKMGLFNFVKEAGEKLWDAVHGSDDQS